MHTWLHWQRALHFSANRADLPAAWHDERPTRGVSGSFWHSGTKWHSVLNILQPRVHPCSFQITASPFVIWIRRPCGVSSSLQMSYKMFTVEGAKESSQPWPPTESERTTGNQKSSGTLDLRIQARERNQTPGENRHEPKPPKAWRPKPQLLRESHHAWQAYILDMQDTQGQFSWHVQLVCIAKAIPSDSSRNSTIFHCIGHRHLFWCSEI